MFPKLTLFSDGAARGNPGPGSCAYVIFDGDKIVDQKGHALGTVTNNVAEYQGLVQGLRRCTELGAHEVSVKSDSELLIKQLEGKYRVRAPHLRPFFEEALKLMKAFPKATLTHVPRDENKLADKLCNEVLDRG